VAKFEDHSFGKETVTLDGNIFIRCSFTGSVLSYSGGPPPALDSCEFSDCSFAFAGMADNTVAFLKAMASPHSGLQRIIRATFPSLTAN
jgi:hypothetical protein